MRRAGVVAAADALCSHCSCRADVIRVGVCVRRCCRGWRCIQWVSSSVREACVLMMPSSLCQRRVPTASVCSSAATAVFFVASDPSRPAAVTVMDAHSAGSTTAPCHCASASCSRTSATGGRPRSERRQTPQVPSLQQKTRSGRTSQRTARRRSSAQPAHICTVHDTNICDVNSHSNNNSDDHRGRAHHHRRRHDRDDSSLL